MAEPSPRLKSRELVCAERGAVRSRAAYLGSVLVLSVAGLGCTGDLIGSGGDDDSLGQPPTGPSTVDQPGVDRATPDGVGWATRFPKLSNEQWENTVKDLFYLDALTGLAKTFVPEPADGGYDNEAAATVTIAGDFWSRYQIAAEGVAKLIVGSPANLNKLVPAGAPTSLPDKAAATISALGRRAYRRPLSAAEASGYLVLYNTGAALDSADAFAGGMTLVIQTMLQSPHFLYRVESAAKPEGERIWLGGFEVATRLAYSLWNTMPSDALLDAAAAGELATPAGVKTWAETMLADPRAATTLRLFHEQTYHTSVYGSQSKDARFGFDAAALGPVLQEEAQLFFSEIIAEGGGIRDILTRPVAFVNEQTAPFYGLTGITGTQLQRVPLNAAERAGFMMQLGFLAQTGARTLTDPVHRGLAVLKQVLCDDPDPPPPIDIQTPTVEPGMTTRATYEQATACGPGCHNTLINPPGFAFEHFDTVGAWREDESGLPIDVSATFGVRVGWTPEAKRETAPILLQFNGAVDLVTQLAAQERTHECYARRMLQFALAKPLDPQERGAGTLLGQRSLADGSLKGILAELVTLNTFRARAPDPL